MRSQMQLFCMSDEIKNRCLGFIVFLICLSGCEKSNHRFQNYPEIIKKHQLEDLHDRAKWEVYKLNTLYGPGYLVNFESDSILRTFVDVHSTYRSKKKNLLQDTTEVQRIVGKNNILPFSKAELVLFPQDSSDLFQENEIVLSFFPEKDEENRW